MVCPSAPLYFRYGIRCLIGLIVQIMASYSSSSSCISLAQNGIEKRPFYNVCKISWTQLIYFGGHNFLAVYVTCTSLAMSVACSHAYLSISLLSRQLLPQPAMIDHLVRDRFKPLYIVCRNKTNWFLVENFFSYTEWSCTSDWVHDI